MLAESFVAATLTPEKPVNNTALGIHVHDLQPLPALKSTFKKSSSKPNCVTVSRTHVFAAQADKAVVHVYSRERNNQESIVPFPERIHSLALAGEKNGAGILALGTEGGRIILWELGTGRQVSTPQHHLQPITCLAVDSTSNFLLSGSTDSSIHVWSLPGLLSFSASSRSNDGQEMPFSPLRSLSTHRSAITAVVFGHSASSSNIAVSASRDGTCIVWDYFSGIALHTYLLPGGPLCLALDPADRAFYVGYEDGSIQLVNFFKQASATNPLYDPALQSTPFQPPAEDRWLPPAESAEAASSAVQCIDLVHDGTLLVSGHQNGKIHTWDIAKGKYGKEVNDLTAPITSLIMLPLMGFPHEPQTEVKLHYVVKPRYEFFTSGNGSSNPAVIPSTYAFTAHFTSDLNTSGSNGETWFHEALMHSSFPVSLLEEGVAEFGPMRNLSVGGSDSAASADLRTQNASLSSQLEEALKQQRGAAAVLQQRDKEDWRRQQDEEIKATKKKKRRLRRIQSEEALRKKQMREHTAEGDEDMGKGEDGEEGDLSSSTDEMPDES